MKIAVCLLCLKPNDIYLSFLNNFNYYDVFVLVDKEMNLENFKNKYNNIIFLQIKTKICSKFNYINSCQEIYHNLPKSISWDKAIFFFSEHEKKYEFIWFIEDDVFFHNENTLLNIDNKYGYCDLLTKEWSKNYKYDKNNKVWDYVKIKGIPEPHYLVEIACCRLSKNFMELIRKYVQNNKTMSCLEAFFPTICIHYNFNLKEIPELNNVLYRFNFGNKHLNKFKIYHPVKNHKKHILFRNYILNKSKLNK